MRLRLNSGKNESSNEPASTTYLSSASSVIGNVVFQNAAIIDGKVEGDVVAMTHLTIGENADFHGRIQAPSVLVCGKVTGNVSAKRIEVRAPAQIVGNLISPVLVIDSGAVLNCRCFMSEKLSEENSPRVEPDAIALKQPFPEKAEEHPQQGMSLLITKRQRAELRTLGYEDGAIDKMTPTDAHRILGVV